MSCLSGAYVQKCLRVTCNVGWRMGTYGHEERNEADAPALANCHQHTTTLRQTQSGPRSSSIGHLQAVLGSFQLLQSSQGPKQGSNSLQ